MEFIRFCTFSCYEFHIFWHLPLHAPRDICIYCYYYASYWELSPIFKIPLYRTQDISCDSTHNRSIRMIYDPDEQICSSEKNEYSSTKTQLLKNLYILLHLFTISSCKSESYDSQTSVNRRFLMPSPSRMLLKQRISHSVRSNPMSVS